jgi:hypothetical protein
VFWDGQKWQAAASWAVTCGAAGRHVSYVNLSNKCMWTYEQGGEGLRADASGLCSCMHVSLLLTGRWWCAGASVLLAGAS